MANRKIIGLIQPFTRVQNFYVYEDGNKIATANPKIEEIADTVFSFMQEYDVNELELIGSKQYNRGLSNKIKEAEMTKFGLNKLKINV